MRCGSAKLCYCSMEQFMQLPCAVFIFPINLCAQFLPSPLPHHYHTASMELHLRPHIYGCKYKASVSAPMITNGPQFTAWFKKMFSFTVLEWQLRPHQFQLYRNECMHICIMRTEMSADCPGDPTYASTQMTRMAMISQKFSSTPVLMPGAFFIHIKQHT